MNRLLTGTLFLALALPARAQLSNLVVTVSNTAGAPVPGATVAALNFQNGQPSASLSALGVSDANGQVKFNGAGTPGTAGLLTAGAAYVVVAARQNYLPSLLSQFSGNPPAVTPAAASTSPAAVAITLSPAAGLGEIDANVSGATPNSLIFGQVGLQLGGGAVAFGLMQTDGGGGGVMQFLDVSFASGGVYNVSGFDPAANASVQAPVNLNLNSLTTPLPGAATPLNFANAPPPVQNINQSQQNSAVSAFGVITDTTAAAAPVPFAQINLSGFYTDAYGQNHYDGHGVNTDQNGVFQFYGLLVGVTYYTTVFPTCNPQTGLCYQGSPSTAAAAGLGAPPGQNDFLYQSTVPFSMRIKLPVGAPGTGTLAVYVTGPGPLFQPLPQVNVSVYGDNSTWQTGGGACGSGGFSNNPGLSSQNVAVSTTYALITGLPSGNYQINAFSPYGQTSYNAGGSTQTYANSSCAAGSTSLRVTIDTTVLPSPDAFIYNVNGGLVANVSSITMIVNVSTSGTGAMTGVVSFPSVSNLTASPISISLSANCSGGGYCPPAGGYTILSSSIQPASSVYSVPLASAVVYQLQVQSNYWAPIFAGGSSNSYNVVVDLTQSTTAVVNMQFVPGGRILGHLHKPDGSIFIPANNQFVSINLNGNGGGSGSGGQVQSDGSYVISGVLPGIYTMSVYGGSSNGANIPFPYTAAQPAPSVSVTANVDTQADLSLANAVNIQPQITIGSLPPLTIFSACSNNNGDCPPETYEVVALPQGSVFNTSLATNLINGNGSGTFPYSVVVGTSTQCNNGGYLTQPGFCAGPLTVSGASGSAYDFYVGRSGSFDSNNYANDARPYFTIETSSRNIVVSPQQATNPIVTPFGSTLTVQNIALTPLPPLGGVQQAVLAGTVTISNVITTRQFAQLGGNFNNFLEYLPVAWVYDSTGSLKAFGLTVPPPVAFTNALQNQLKAAVATNNYKQFLTVLGQVGPPGYEIRGLTAGQTYSLVLTSPNYPPYKTSVTLGAAGSITTADVNFDSNPGSNLNGVVLSTNSAVIVGAQVTVQASGYPATTLTTDTSGSWQLNGLGAGQYQILATAPGFAQQAQNVNVSGSGPVLVPSFVLTRSNASIIGTIYTNNPICPAGVICSAFGKTVLQGAVVLAYDDTVNVLNPSAVLPLYRGVSNSSGIYEIDGLQTGDIYKVFAQVPGYYVLNQTTLTATGQVTGFDFAMQPKPLDVNVYGTPVGSNYQFQITNYSQFSSGNAWIGLAPFSATASSINVSNLFVQQPDSQGNPQLILDYPLGSLLPGTLYDLHVVAQPNNPSAGPIVKDVPFGVNVPNNTCQAIDSTLVGDSADLNAQGLPMNQAPLDISGLNGSGVSLPAGGVIPLMSTSVPSMCMTNTDPSASPQAGVLKSTGAFASGVYQVTLSSVNYTAKGFNLTFAYSQNGAALNDLAVYTFNSALNEWQSVPGLQTLNPVQGTISVNGLKSLASVLSVESAGAKRLQALSDGRSYRPNAVPLLPDDSGLFAVLRPSQLSAGTFSGGTLVVYNFPNPFNLQNKTVPLNSTASNACTGLTSPQVATNGTVIKFEVPPGMSGHGVIRIYTLSGRLVRELDQGQVNGGTCTYTEWDGTNRNGLPVANGVYYGILTVGGSKASSGTFKMAVIK